VLIEVDFKKRVGEIKERNQFYKTLLEVRQTAKEATTSEDLANCKQQLQDIISKCEQALDGLI
jgi:hypothetical protein